jgi:hypothetical protein
MGSSGGGGNLAAILRSLPERDQLALLQSMQAGSGMGGGGGARGRPNPDPTASDGSHMGAGDASKFDFTDPRYTSRLAEGSGPKASRPDMSAMMDAAAANPPAPPPLPGGYPLPRK